MDGWSTWSPWGWRNWAVWSCAGERLEKLQLAIKRALSARYPSQCVLGIIHLRYWSLLSHPVRTLGLFRWWATRIQLQAQWRIRPFSQRRVYVRRWFGGRMDDGIKFKWNSLNPILSSFLLGIRYFKKFKQRHLFESIRSYFFLSSPSRPQLPPSLPSTVTPRRPR